MTQVLRYFIRHPHAVDDLEGIARWRLVEDTIRARVEETQRALGWLVDHGYLCLTHTSGPVPVFSLNPRKLADAAALVDGGTTRREDH